jgi:hypothetical protein
MTETKYSYGGSRPPTVRPLPSAPKRREYDEHEKRELAEKPHRISNSAWLSVDKSVRELALPEAAWLFRCGMDADEAFRLSVHRRRMEELDRSGGILREILDDLKDLAGVWPGLYDGEGYPTPRLVHVAEKIMETGQRHAEEILAADDGGKGAARTAWRLRTWHSGARTCLLTGTLPARGFRIMQGDAVSPEALPYLPAVAERFGEIAAAVARLTPAPTTRPEHEATGEAEASGPSA